LVHQTNHKLVASLNKGLRLVTGQYVARQDADDISLPSRFEKELAWLAGDKQRGVVGSYFTYIDTESSKPSITLTFPTKHIDIARMLYYTNPLAHGSVLMKKEAIIGAGGYKTTYPHNEDYDLWRRLRDHWQLGIIPEVLYLYRINQNSISHTNQSTQHASARKLVEKLWHAPVPLKKVRDIIADAYYYGRLPGEHKPTVRQQYIGQQVQLAYDCLRRGRLRAGYPTALAALRLQPRSFFRLLKPLLFALPKRIMGR